MRQEEDAKRKSEEAARLAREAKLREKEKLQRVSGRQSCFLQCNRHETPVKEGVGFDGGARGVS